MNGRTWLVRMTSRIHVAPGLPGRFPVAILLVMRINHVPDYSRTRLVNIKISAWQVMMNGQVIT